MANGLTLWNDLNSVDRLFKSAFGEDFAPLFAAPRLVRNGVAPLKVEVREDNGGYVVLAELPGVAKENIHVNIDGDVVSIDAEVKREKELKEGERVLRSERYVGKVSRSFRLANEVDEAQASAKYADGVLELTLPKKTAQQSKRLTVQ